MANHFNQKINEMDERVKALEEIIAKYKKLAPKSKCSISLNCIAFKLMDLTLDEIFNAMNIIEHDATKIWTALSGAYPKNYFDGVIEDTYGAFLDPEQQEELAN